MAWITTYQFKLDFAAAKRATTAQAQMAIDAAEDELIELVGQEAVDDALEASPSDTVRAAKLIRGHKFLAIAIFLLNVRNVKREQETSSPVQTATVTNEYWTPKEITEMAAQWRAMALRALQSYLIVDATGDDYAAAPEYEHPDITLCPDVCTPTSNACC
jgi:hypothetical protein